MATVLRLLSGRAGGYLLAGVVALAAWGAWTARGNQLDRARADVARLTAEGAVLSRDILAQNAAVAEMEARAADQARRLADAQRRAATTAAQADARVRAALTATVPADCAAAVAWAAQRGAEIAREWNAP